jgi:hypothetical protein
MRPKRWFSKLPPPTSLETPRNVSPPLTPRRNSRSAFDSLFPFKPFPANGGIKKRSNNSLGLFRSFGLRHKRSSVTVNTDTEPDVLIQFAQLQSRPLTRSNPISKLTAQLALHGNEVLLGQKTVVDVDNEVSGSDLVMDTDRRTSDASFNSLATLSPRASRRLLEKQVIDKITHPDSVTRSGDADELTQCIKKLAIEIPPLASDLGDWTPEQDKLQRDLIRGILDGRQYLHPAFKISYEYVSTFQSLAYFR